MKKPFSQERSLIIHQFSYIFSSSNSRRLHLTSIIHNPPTNLPRTIRLLPNHRSISNRTSNRPRLPPISPTSSHRHREMVSLRNCHIRSRHHITWKTLSSNTKMGKDKMYQGDCGILLHLEEDESLSTMEEPI